MADDAIVACVFFVCLWSFFITCVVVFGRN